MGTDIHLYVEQLVDGTWRCVSPPERDLERWPRRDNDSYSWGPGECMEEEAPCWVCHRGDARCAACLGTRRGQYWYSKRNYSLFGILAGVRYDDLPCIAAPRGVPPDVDPRIVAAATWGYSPSWLDLAEILAFDWDQTDECWATLPVFPEEPGPDAVESYQEWMQRCGGRGAPRNPYRRRDGVRVELDEAAALVAGKVARDPSAPPPLVGVSWTLRLRDHAPDFLEFIDELVLPLLGPAYRALRLVIEDAREAEHPELATMEEEMRALLSTVRFVFGFD